MEIEEQRARGVGHVGDVSGAARQTEDEIAVDRTEGQLAPIGTLAQPGVMIEQPGDLGGGEVRNEEQTGRLTYALLGTLRAQLVARGRGAPILPDDGGATGRPVARSQITVVSRWLVMPTAAIGPAGIWARASPRAASTEAQIASGSCST